MESKAPVLNLASHGHEGLLHIGGILCTGLKEWDINLISECLHAKGLFTFAEDTLNSVNIELHVT